MNQYESDLEFINDHRVNLDYSPFDSLTKSEMDHHLSLIEEHAPYGNDPWGGDAQM